jgi:recombination protein RecT
MPTTSAVGQALEAQSQATPEEAVAPTLQKAIDLLRPQVARALPNTLDPDRFIRIVLTEVRRNPVLQFASQESFLGAVMAAAQLGLEFGPLGFVYLVPFKNKGKQECQLIVGYKGLIDLHLRSGRVKSIVARPVYERDAFRVAYDETGDHLIHEPHLGSDRGPIVRYYGRAVLDDGGSHLEIMELDDIRARRNRSKAADSGPWKTDEVAMSCKTVVRKMSPWLPASAILAEALEADENVVRLEGTRLVVDRDDTPPGGEAELLPPPRADANGNGAIDATSHDGGEDLGEPPQADEHGEIQPQEGQSAEAGAEEPSGQAAPQNEGQCSHGRSLEDQCEECDADEQEYIRAEAEAAAAAQREAAGAEAPAAAEESGEARAASEEQPPPQDPRGAAQQGGPRSLAQKDADRIMAIVEGMTPEKIVELLRGFGLGTQGNANSKVLRLYQRIAEGVLAGDQACLDLV